MDPILPRPDFERDTTLDLLFADPPVPSSQHNLEFCEHVQAGRSNEVLQLLTDNLVAVDAILDEDKNTALHLILRREEKDLEEQYVEVAKHLVAKRCRWDLKNTNEKTALQLGIANGRVEVLLLLWEKRIGLLTLDKLLAEVVCCMKDNDEKARENAVFTVARIFEEVDSDLYVNGIDATMQGLYQSLEDVSIEVCKRSCKALHNFAVRCGKDAIGHPYYGNKLLDHFPRICQKLLDTTSRTDWPNNQLRHTIPYETLVKVIQNAPFTSTPDVQKLLLGALSRLEKHFKIKIVDNNNNNNNVAPFVPDHLTNIDPTLAITTPATTNNNTVTTTTTTTITTTITIHTTNIENDTEEIPHTLLSALCSVMVACVQKISLTDLMVNDKDDRIMHCLLQVFNERDESSSSSIREDTLLTISAMIEKFETKMTRYIPQILPVILLLCLQNPHKTTVLISSLRVVSDLCRALKNDMLPYYHHCDDIVRRVLELLNSSDIDRSFNLAAIDLFGCMALNLERDFDRYVFLVLDVLKTLSTDLIMVTEPNDEEKNGEGPVSKDIELIKYHDHLRMNLLECYTAIIQGLHKKHDLVLSAMNTIHHLLQHCAQHFTTPADGEDDKKANWECKQAAWRLLLELGQTYGLCNNQCKTIFLQPFVFVLIDIGKLGKNIDPVSEKKPVEDGLIRTLGTTRGYTNLYYCGRRLGIRAIPGSDGQCGPNNGPQCTDCVKYQQEHGYIPPIIPDASKLAAIQMENIVKQLHSVESGSSIKTDMTMVNVEETVQSLVPPSISSIPITFKERQDLSKKKAKNG